MKKIRINFNDVIGVRKIKRVISGLLVTAMVVSGVNISVTKEAEASTINNNTSVKPVEVPKDTLFASSAKYKDMDYSFLSDYQFGDTYKDVSIAQFNSVEEMKKSTLSNLKEGRIIRTNGFYKYGDGGACSYKLSKQGTAGSILMSNGLYANPVADIYKDKEGNEWFVVNVMQLGATPNDDTEDNIAINDALSLAASDSDNYRGILFIPQGEYKLGNQIHIQQKNISVVGSGDGTVLYTDNDYRDEEGYAEHLIQVWGAQNCYIADFVVEAREVDLYNYMRQFSCIYASDIYVKDVDLIVPQEAFNGYEYQDKQYSNFCCYTGNKRITVDGCKMVQMTGTYRGANFGVLDIWAAGEEDITVMNCDMYGNARDEQIGIFSRDNSNAYVHNVEFINNTIHAYQPRDLSAAGGNATMRFTVAYTDSNDIDNVHIAGNHFIVEIDSKFMTFGKLTNCVVEDNIIEIYCTYRTWSMVFDSSNSNPENILIRNNEFFISSNENIGKGNVVGGNLTMEGNRIVTDVSMPFGVLSPVLRKNTIIAMEPLGYLTVNGEFTDNTVYLYDSVCSVGVQNGQYASYGGENINQKFTGNTIYDYTKQDTDRLYCFHSMLMLDGDIESLDVSNNKIYSPYSRWPHSDLNDTLVENENGKYYLNRLFRRRSGTIKNVTVSNNEFQGVYLPESNDSIVYSDNKSINPVFDYEDKKISKMDMTIDGKVVTEISTDSDSVQLGNIQYYGEKAKVTDETTGEEKEVVTDILLDENRAVDYITSVDSIATVDNNGVVKRKMYGDVHVYAAALDGSGKYAEIVIHFQKKKAASIKTLKEKIILQPGLEEYCDYEVLPAEASQEVLWSSENEEVATVNYKGVVKGVSVGETDIVCRTADGAVTKKIHVVIEEVTAKKIYMEKTYLYFTNDQIGETAAVKVKSFSPAETANQTISRWKSTNENVAIVDDNGNITVTGTGVCGIRAYSADGKCYGNTDVYVQTDQVKNLRVTQKTTGTVNLAWDEVPNTYGYYVYQFNDETNEWKQVGDKYTTNKGIKISNLSAGKQYKYKVTSFISNWSTGSRILYESEPNAVSTILPEETPVTKIGAYQNWSTITLFEGNSPIYTNNKGEVVSNMSIQLSADNQAANRELEFEYDKDMLEIVEISKGTTEYITTNDEYTYTLFIKGLKPGFSKLIAKAKDGCGAKREISVFVFPDEKVSNIEYQVKRHSVDITFDGINDESEITGYAIAKRVGYHWEYAGYIDKAAENEKAVGENGVADAGKAVSENGDTGNESAVGESQDKSNKYTYHYTDDIREEEKIRFAIIPYANIDKLFFYGRDVWVNSVYEEGNSVTIPAVVPASECNMNEKIYYLNENETKNIFAQVSKDSTICKLDWYIGNSEIAGVMTDNRQTDDNKDYASLIGVRCGVTSVYAMTTDDSDITASSKVVVLPQKAENLKVTSEPGKKVTITWDEVQNVPGYIVYRSVQGKNEFIQIGETIENKFTDNNSESMVNYEYAVAPYVTDGIEKYAADKSASVTAYGLMDINNTDIKISKSKFTYNTKVQKPDITIDGLKSGVDYTVTYSNSKSVNAGKYTFVVKGIGRYAGSKSFTYEISKKKAYIYGIRSKITKKYGDSSFSLCGRTSANAKLTYKSSNRKIATVDSKGKVKIVGCGKVTLTVISTGSNHISTKKYSTILVKPRKVLGIKVRAVGKYKIKVDWTRDSKSSGYILEYATNNKFTGKKVIRIKGSRTNVKYIGNLKKNKYYYVRVRAYSTSNIMGDFSNAKTVKVK